ncbi:MAG: glycoside hydrolase, partial [Hymenobacter sp.]|nr:glycoside hydrolase [Hymenobacter sp.]
NGPHQGAWVTTPDGRQDWFLHFQDQGPYGRVVHLQPMRWLNDWPVIGTDPDGDGTGEPVLTHRKPALPGRPAPLATPATSDEFNANALGLQWQWHANPQPGWALPAGNLGYLRLYAVPLPTGFQNFWQVPNLLLQKLPAAVCTATTKLTFTPRFEGEKVGLLLMGMDYAYLALTNAGGQLQLTQTLCSQADKQGQEVSSAPLLLPQRTVYLRVAVAAGAKCQFSYSLDGQTFQPVGGTFQAREGRWIGAKMGLFCTRAGSTNDAGYADIDWFRVE